MLAVSYILAIWTKTALTLLAQISDTHIRAGHWLTAGIDTAPYLRDAIASIGRLSRNALMRWSSRDLTALR